MRSPSHRRRATLATCYWIDGRKFQNIGHLSDEQFAEVERLFAEQVSSQNEKDYSDRADELIYDGDNRRHLDNKAPS